MQILKRFIIILSILLTVVLSGHYLPMALKITPKKLLNEYTYRGYTSLIAIVETSTDKDSTNYLERIKKSLTVNKIKKHRKSITWYVSNGIDLPVHTLSFQQSLKKNNCILLTSKENNRTPASLYTTFKCANNKEYALTIKIGDAFTNTIAQLAVVFKTSKSISIENMKLLDELTIPYTLLVDPYEKTETIFYDIKKLNSSFETVLLIPMEPLNYPYVNPGKNALYIHNTSEEIENKLDRAYNKLPKSIGIATINGTRAIVHTKLLQTVLEYTAAKRDLFIDLTRSSRSKAGALCSEYRMTCPRLRYYTFADIERYLNKNISIAQKKGEHTIAIPLTTKNLKAVKKIISKSSENGVTFVKLSSLS